ncbi:hypothetical protein QTO34_016478 [Cnephaeus nilssonii]|uniref:Uncharacterized protein n=1 Tax=Cnephaeus nilssonii TaxID=3371016 RepID=A0AA40LQE4_CNENI|nr:hypothetical protein QTO34_016478 [Eptesicus nilssonii]
MPFRSGTRPFRSLWRLVHQWTGTELPRIKRSYDHTPLSEALDEAMNGNKQTNTLIRSGLGAAENHCLNLSGVCRRDICKIIEDTIGGCRRRYKCCRAWWVLIPVPTPVIYSEYQEPLKPRDWPKVLASEALEGPEKK